MGDAGQAPVRPRKNAAVIFCASGKVASSYIVFLFL